MILIFVGLQLCLEGQRERSTTKPITKHRPQPIILIQKQNGCFSMRCTENQPSRKGSSFTNAILCKKCQVLRLEVRLQRCRPRMSITRPAKQMDAARIRANLIQTTSTTLESKASNWYLSTNINITCQVTARRFYMCACVSTSIVHKITSNIREVAGNSTHA